MGKEKKEKKEKTEKESGKAKNKSGKEEDVAENTAVKSIADLFSNTPTDPTLEALFKTPVPFVVLLSNLRRAH
jgi:hypothetical protein